MQIDPKTKRSQADKIKRRFTHEIKASDFARTKSTFWVRARGFNAEFIHLHLFTFMPAFRVHLGVRVWNDNFVAVALNGPCSHDGWHETGGRKLVFDFDHTEPSVDRCVADLAAYCHDIAEPWFRGLREPEQLLNSPDSPLDASVRELFKMAMSGKEDANSVALSAALLGTGPSESE